MRKVLYLLPLSLLVTFLRCGGEPRPRSKLGGELIAPGNPLSGFDPAVVNHIWSSMIASQLFDGLLQYHPGDFKLVPALAEKWETPDHGRTWIFHLRRGARFNNDACFPDGIGREVVASDFKYSLERIINWREDDNTWKIFCNIEGAEDFRMGQSGHVRGITAVDAYSLQIRLTKPSFMFLHRLANLKGAVVPREAVQAYGPRFREHPVGTGPFRLVSWDPAHSVYLVKNPNYWEFDSVGARLPYLDALRFPLTPGGRYTAFDANTFPQFDGKDLAFVAATTRDSQKLIRAYNLRHDAKHQIRVYTTPVANTFFFAFRMDADTPWARNKLLRQAVAHGADWGSIAREDGPVMKGKGLVPPGFGGYHSSVEGYEYNPKRAAELLRMAGFPKAQGLPPLVVHLPGNVSSPPGGIWRKLAHDLAALGIRMEWKYSPTAVHFEGVARGEFEVFRDGWIADYPDPFDFFQLFYSRSFSNHSRYSNPEYDTLFEQAEQELDQPTRFKLFHRMEEILFEDCPAIFYMHEVESLGINPSVHSLELSINPFRMRFYKYVWIEP